MQPDKAEVGRLPIVGLVAEEYTERISGVHDVRQFLLDDVFVGNEAQTRVGIAQQRDDQAGQRAGHPAVRMGFSKARGVREPREKVAQSADRKLDQYVLVAWVVIVRHDRARFPGCAVVDRPDFDPEADGTIAWQS